MNELTSFHCHQSGVNSLALDSTSMQDAKYCFMATGGDDNQISLFLFHNMKNSFIVMSSLKLSTSHSAQVTGIKLCKIDSYLFIMSSVSIDQRLIRWRVDIQKDMKLSCQELGCVFTHVSDVASMDVNEENYFVCGQGLSHYVFAPEKKSIAAKSSFSSKA